MPTSLRTTLPLLLLIALGVPSPAQTTLGSLVGLVRDASGAVVPNAEVAATHTATGVRSATRTNTAGLYTLPQLKDGTYRVQVRAPGFAEHDASGVLLQPRETRRVDVELSVDATRTSVQVTADAGLVQTESATVSDVRSTNEINTLPLPTRSVRNFLALSPTVLNTSAGDANRYRIGGAQYTQVDITIDGVSVNNYFIGSQTPELLNYVESMQEVRIDSANNGADAGAMGQVTLVSKSGTNELHGSAFTYYSTPAFRARNPFATERATGVAHQPGVSLGGPVRIPRLYNGRNRTFFFGSFEGARGSQTAGLRNANVPLAAWREGDFSGVTGLTLLDPATGQPFPGNRIPASRINPVARRIQERFYPLPNFGDPGRFAAGNFREVLTRPFDTDTYTTARLDHRLNDKHSVYARGTYQRLRNFAFDSQLPALGLNWLRRDTRNLLVSHSWLPSTRLVNEFRFGMMYHNGPRSGAVDGPSLVRELGLAGLSPDLPEASGVLSVNWANLALTGISQTRFRKPGFQNLIHQFQEQASFFLGKHSIKAGVNLTRVYYGDFELPEAMFGQVNFSGRFTGQAYADFLLGIPTNASRAFTPIRQDRVRWMNDLFVNDDWKATPRLTLNLGVRYEVHPGWVERDDEQAVFDVASGRIVVPNGALSRVSPLLPRGYVDVVEAREAGLPGRALVRTDRNNFAPRVGFAFRPWDNNTVVRGGFAVFYDVVNRHASVGVPFNINEPQFVNPSANYITLPRVFPETAAGPTSVTLPDAINPNLQIPLSTQTSLTLEHQRWSTGFRLSFIRSDTRDGEWLQNVNQPVGDARLFVDKPRLFPRYPAVNYYTNGATHQYHGLTLEAERRSRRGLFWQAAYTLQRDIGTGYDRGIAPEDAYNLDRERDVIPDYPTHRLTSAMIYDLPFGKGRPFLGGAGKALNAVAGGWSVSATYTASSGQPLVVTWTGADPTGTAFTGSRTPALVTRRPDRIGDGSLPADQRSAAGWLDLSAFAAPQPGRFGTSSRAPVLGPGYQVFNAGVYKQFAFGERARLRAEMTGSNALNHTNLGNPNTNITSGQFGVINGVRGGLELANQRTMRAGLRLEF